MRPISRRSVLRGVRAGQSIDGPQQDCDTAIVPGDPPTEDVEVTSVDVRPGESEGELIMDVEATNSSDQTLDVTVSVSLGDQTDAFRPTIEPGESASFTFDNWDAFEPGVDYEGCATVSRAEVV